MGGKPPKGKVLRREEPQRKNEPTNPPHTTKIQQRQPEVERPTKLGKPATEPPVQAIFSLKEITLVGSMTDGWCGSPEKDDHGLLCPICRQSDESEFVQGTCNHQFHMTCIQRWTARRSECPLCARDWEFDKIIENKPTNNEKKQTTIFEKQTTGFEMVLACIDAPIKILLLKESPLPQELIPLILNFWIPKNQNKTFEHLIERKILPLTITKKEKNFLPSSFSNQNFFLKKETEEILFQKIEEEFSNFGFFKEKNILISEIHEKDFFLDYFNFEEINKKFEFLIENQNSNFFIFQILNSIPFIEIYLTPKILMLKFFFKWIGNGKRKK